MGGGRDLHGDPSKEADIASHDQHFKLQQSPLAGVLGSRLGRRRFPQHQLLRGVQEPVGPSKPNFVLGAPSELCQLLPSPVHSRQLWSLRCK